MVSRGCHRLVHNCIFSQYHPVAEREHFQAFQLRINSRLIPWFANNFFSTQAYTVICNNKSTVYLIIKTHIASLIYMSLPQCRWSWFTSFRCWLVLILVFHSQMLGGIAACINCIPLGRSMETSNIHPNISSDNQNFIFKQNTHYFLLKQQK